MKKMSNRIFSNFSFITT